MEKEFLFFQSFWRGFSNLFPTYCTARMGTDEREKWVRSCQVQVLKYKRDCEIWVFSEGSRRVWLRLMGDEGLPVFV